VSLEEIHYTTFKQGSRTYFNSSLFFPRKIRRDVFALYGFVRIADNFVDSVPQDPEGSRMPITKHRRARLSGIRSSMPLSSSAGEKLSNPRGPKHSSARWNWI